MMINLAAFDLETRALGPGIRSAVWVQGCPFNCRGCISPEWIPQREARLIAPADLAETILSSPDVEGLTLSGGEPMLQAAALLELVRLVRRKRAITVICFTGFTLSQLQKNPPSLDTAEFLSEIDLLVDGPYEMDRNNDLGLRGSSNQQFHYLSKAFEGIDFAVYPRKVELKIFADEIQFTGIPTRSGLTQLDRALQTLQKQPIETVFSMKMLDELP